MLTLTELCVLAIHLWRSFDVLLWSRRTKRGLLFQTQTRSLVSSSLFKKAHTNLITCITFPSPLHDLLKALCRSDRDQLESCWTRAWPEWLSEPWHVFLLTFFLSSRSCSSFWKCFSLSRRWRSASSRALASASSLWKMKKYSEECFFSQVLILAHRKVCLFKHAATALQPHFAYIYISIQVFYLVLVE